MKPDGGLWSWLSPTWRAETCCHVQRIENAIEDGTPDVELCRTSVSVWVELKAADLPARPGTPIRVKFQPGQVGWHRKRALAGGVSWILLRLRSPRTARTVGHYLVPGTDAPELETGVSRERLAELSVIPPEARPLEILRACVS